MESIAPTPEDELLAELLHALGNPTRLAITRYIANNPGCICNDLVVRFNRAQATVSQHLATLRQAHIVVAERDGQATCYWIDPKKIVWVQQRLEQFVDRAVPQSND